MFGTITITFILSHVVPSNPAVLFAGQNPTPQQIQQITQELGLNKPLYTQYILYVEQILHGNFGQSYSYSLDPVRTLILQALPNSFTLAALATILAAIIGIPLGIEAAKRTGTRVDSLLRVFSVAFVALPTFWLALLFQILFATDLKILPLSSYGGTLLYTDLHPIRTISGSYFLDSILTGNVNGFLAVSWSLVLPVLTLALYPIGVVIRQTRNSMQGVLNQDYIRTAKAFGISPREINYKFAFRNALGPIIVILGLIFAGSVIGVVFVEDVFVLQPGLGALICHAAGTCITSTSFASVDYPLILGIATMTSFIYIAANFTVDVVQIYMDRRILK